MPLKNHVCECKSECGCVCGGVIHLHHYLGPIWELRTEQVTSAEPRWSLPKVGNEAVSSFLKMFIEMQLIYNAV